MKRLIIALVLILSVLIYSRFHPLREFNRIPVYIGDTNVNYPVQKIDKEKKTILIVAYNKGTEIFDLVAPFYLFSLTKQANVLIVAPAKKPIAVMTGFFVLPHYTFKEIDDLQIEPSVLIIPNLSGVPKKDQDQQIIQWIKGKYSSSTIVLSICAGSITAASTGLYDQKEMTTHASEMKMNKEQFTNPKWISGVTYTRDGNLYSTAGVSNAVEGSLAVINDLFGKTTMNAIMDSIHYPFPALKKEHQSVTLKFSNKIDIIKKILFQKNKKVGVLLQDSIDEFNLAAILDAYHRTFPASIHTFAMNKKFITSRFGLTLLPTGNALNISASDELHILHPEYLSRDEENFFNQSEVIKYPPNNREYIFSVSLAHIRSEYGAAIQTVVKRLLDYN